MQKTKKRNAVMLADTRPALVGTVLLQLQKTNPNLFDEAIIYYVDPIAPQDQRLMSSILPCRFVKYAPPLPEELFKKERFRLFSVLMFARYEMFSYLTEFETITWLDTDILVQADLSGMLELARKTGAALICEDPINKTAENPDCMRTCFTTDVAGYKMDSYLYCSGTIVLTDKVNQTDAYTRWCYEKTVEWADILSLPDQGVINAAIQSFQIKVTPLLGKDFCCYPYMGRDCANATIIHAWGLNKFWNDWYVHEHYSAWAGYYQQWISLGGCAMPTEIAPRISVVIPTYKPNSVLLRQCLDSLMSQTRAGWERFSDFEIIIVAEPFETEQIQKVVDSYHDKRIHLEINKERLGIAASLNRAIRMARGRYIARIDDDDVAAPDRFYLQANYLDAHPTITLCTSDFEYFGDMNERRVSFEGELCRAWSIFTCPFDHPTIMFRKAFFVEQELFYDEKRGYVEDWELWLRAFEQGMTVGCIHQVLFYHRWMNTGSAGQTNKTVDMMRELIQRNFMRLNVDIPTDDLALIGPWNGRLLNNEDVERLQYYFAQTLLQNEKLHLYNQAALEQALMLRLEEAKTGVLPGLSEKLVREEHTQAGSEVVASPVIDYVATRRPSLIRRFFKALLKPLYKPFRHRYEDRIIDIQKSSWTTEGHVINCIHKLDQISATQNEQLKIILQRLDALEQTSLQRLDALEQTNLQQLEASEQTNLQQLEASGQATLQRLDALREIVATSSSTLHTQIGNQSAQESQLLTMHFSSALESHSEAIQKKLTLANDHIYDLQQTFRFEQSFFAAERKVQKKIFLIGTPEHSNIGDAAITIGELEFIRQYFAEYRLIELSTYDFPDWYGRLSSLVNGEDLIFLQGGGNMGNRYLVEEELRRRVISDFPSNQIVILPQTISFDDSEDGRQQLALSAAIYNRHSNLSLFTRGAESLAFARTHFPKVKSAEMLDLALMLSEDYGIERDGILLCIRDLGDESGLSVEQYRFVEEVVRHFGVPVVKTNNLNQGEANANIYKDMRRSVLTAELKKFAGCRVVVTDRLHGMIFSIITHTPCVVLSSRDHKIKDFCSYFESSNAVFFLDRQIDAIEEAIKLAMQVQTSYYPILEEEPFHDLAKQIGESV